MTSLLLALAASAALNIQQVDPLAPHGPALNVQVVGRALTLARAQGSSFERQWPGTYLEAAFRGPEALFEVGPGDVSLRVTVDTGVSAALVRPVPGLYRVSGLPSGPHRLRVQVVSESQAGPTEVGPIYAAAAEDAMAPPQALGRQIEFIGDSYTVGYGNTSATRACSDAEVWARTDTSQGIGGLMARRYGADVEVNAISGRGVVRNYGGFTAPTLPEAYPQSLLGGSPADHEPLWRPQVVIVGLGTNDFSTALRTGERWPDRGALHADFGVAYARFLHELRARNPKSLIVVWATDGADGEIAREVGRVVAILRGAGDARIRFAEVRGLTLSACNSHPTVTDDQRIAISLSEAIDADPQAWR
jgi:lysophospholipase L1-like esterase